jgi:hypothetical protein
MAATAHAHGVTRTEYACEALAAALDADEARADLSGPPVARRESVKSERTFGFFAPYALIARLDAAVWRLGGNRTSLCGGGAARGRGEGPARQ